VFIPIFIRTLQIFSSKINAYYQIVSVGLIGKI